MEHFNAVKMRPTGGCFFIPKSSLDSWNKFVSDYTQSTSNIVHRVQSGVDANTATAVMETASQDLDERYKEAIDDLNDLSKQTELSSRRMQTKRTKLMQRLNDIASTADDISSSFGQASQVADRIRKTIAIQQAMAIL